MRTSIRSLVACIALGLACTNLNAAEPALPILETNQGSGLEAPPDLPQIQEQLRSTIRALERMRMDSDEAAARNAEDLLNSKRFLESRLKTMEDSLAQNRAAELHALQNSNRLTLTLAGGLAVLGFCAMLLTAFFQWRTIKRLTEMSPATAGWPELSPSPVVKGLAFGESIEGTVERSNQRLLGALGQLETRLQGLEERTRPMLQNSTAPASVGNGPASLENVGETSLQPESGSAPWFIAHGDSLLQANDPAQALQAFEEALKTDPGNNDALIRKGSALEKLGRLDEAVASYDLAISGDPSLTIAYLRKGGLLNRTEKFSEALECYEKALRTQEKHLA